MFWPPWHNAPALSVLFNPHALASCSGAVCLVGAEALKATILMFVTMFRLYLHNAHSLSVLLDPHALVSSSGAVGLVGAKALIATILMLATMFWQPWLNTH